MTEQDQKIDAALADSKDYDQSVSILLDLGLSERAAYSIAAYKHDGDGRGVTPVEQDAPPAVTA